MCPPGKTPSAPSDSTPMFNAQRYSTGHRECHKAVDGPCSRCSPRPPRICCDLCSPEEFVDMFQVPNAGPKSQSHRSKIKDYIPNERDKKLRQWLDDWRQKTSEDVYGKSSINYFGCSTVMLDSILERICDAAHQNLISSVDDLHKETRWYLTHKYGQTVIDAIKTIMPATLPPSESHPAKTPKVHKCSSCGRVGHTSELF
jgi:hypothetical protein